MRREFKNPYIGFKSDRERLWALVSRDLRIVAVAALCAGATDASHLVRDALARWF